MDETSIIKFCWPDADIDIFPPSTFNWSFGREGLYFENDTSFQALKNILSCIRVHTEHIDVSVYNYASKLILDEKDNNLRILASNADTPNWSKSDDILHRAIAGLCGKGSLRYVSWSRDVTMLSEKHHEDCVLKLQPLTSGRNVIEVKTHLGYSFSKNELLARSHDVIDCVEDLSTEKTYNIDGFKNGTTTLLLHISLDDKMAPHDRRNKGVWSLQKACGAFERIIILDRVSTLDSWLEWSQDVNLHYSYFISRVEWSGGRSTFDRNVIIVWDLRRS